MRIACLQHADFEPPGLFANWAGARTHDLVLTKTYRDELPASGADAMIILGGPMSVNDAPTLPWLQREIAAIHAHLAQDRPTFGVCLGAQLIAHCLGARVRKNATKEIGWFPVTRVPPAPATKRALSRSHQRWFDLVPPEFTPLHWHGETFDLPPGATHLARSAACENQMFVARDAIVGIQFHLEAAADWIAESLDAVDADRCGGPWEQPRETLMPPADRMTENAKLLYRWLDAWLAP